MLKQLFLTLTFLCSSSAVFSEDSPLGEAPLGLEPLSPDAEAWFDNTDHLHLNDSTDYDSSWAMFHDTVSYSRYITSGFGTLCLPFSYSASDFSSPIKLFKIGTRRDTLLILSELTSVTAGTPVIFYTEAPSTIYVEVANVTTVSSPIATTSSATMTGTFLRDTVSTNASSKYYIKNNRFRRGEESFIVLPYHAMVHVAGQSNPLKSLSLSIDDSDLDISDGLDIVSPPTVVGIYNLQGQPVSSPIKHNIYFIRYSDGAYKKFIFN